jgi:DNA-binding response OmpR family regulator
MQPAPPCILIVDDDPAVRELLTDYLTESGYEASGAAGGAELRAFLAQRSPDLVLLDVGLPGEDGLSLARFLRERYDLPVIMVSGAGEAVDRIVGLEIGADDYIAKPFDPRELRARVKSVLRRYRRSEGNAAREEAAPKRLPVGAHALDLEARCLFRFDGEEIALTSMEFDLLRALAERPNRALSRDQLLNLTQNRDWDPFDRSIDIRIARLRRKIEADPDKPTIIRTVRGVGYMFIPASPPSDR